MKCQFILHDKNIVRITSNQPPIPCFKAHKTWRLSTIHVNHRLLLHVALVFSTIAWLWMFLTEFALIFRSLFRYCGARGKFLTLKNIVCFTHNLTVHIKTECRIFLYKRIPTLIQQKYVAWKFSEVIRKNTKWKFMQILCNLDSLRIRFGSLERDYSPTFQSHRFCLWLTILLVLIVVVS